MGRSRGSLLAAVKKSLPCNPPGFGGAWKWSCLLLGNFDTTKLFVLNAPCSNECCGEDDGGRKLTEQLRHCSFSTPTKHLLKVFRVNEEN